MTYLDETANIIDHKEKEEKFIEMLSILLIKINEIAKEGDFYEVADNLFSAAYYMEEFDFKEAKQIYTQSIEYYEKYMYELQKQGKFEEASWIANQIAEIYYNKLNNKTGEKRYILKCIDYNNALIELLNGFSNTRKLAIISYNLGELYLKIEDWDNAIDTFSAALVISKNERFYDITANIYYNLSDIYLLLGKESNSIDLLEEADKYFKSEEKKIIKRNDNYSLSQIYQILKNLNASLNKPSEYRKFSRNEAVAYIRLAKENLKQQMDYHKIASLYRGAGLCFKDTETDFLEGASSFVIAGNIFENCNEFTESSLCYNDAAELYEHLKIYDKVIKLYIQAANHALKEMNYEFAIEKLMNGFNLAEIKNFKEYYGLIADRIKKNLLAMSKIQVKEEKYFIAGTLLLEMLPYYRKTGFSMNSNEVKSILKQIYHYYQKEYNNDYNNGKSSTLAYIRALTALSQIALGNYDNADQIITDLKVNNSKIIQAYKKIIKEMLNAVRSNTVFDLSDLDENVKKVYSNAEEIKLFNNLIFY
ncbi:MAG: tetratricopeptide repeat protein [Candidatus Lokiarchaeota archaeon]|nr:tetratricopeptide repeat protein [Candidatus Lokiarchaeota archaeon]